MNYAECVSRVKQVFLQHTDTPSNSVDEYTPIGDKVCQMAKEFNLIGSNPLTTVGDIAQVLYEREVVRDH